MKWHTTFVMIQPQVKFPEELQAKLDSLQGQNHTIFTIVGPVQNTAGGHTGMIIVSHTKT